MKPYVKPELYYENFELAQHIAGCAFTTPEITSPETCKYYGTIGKKEGWWFIGGNSVCDTEGVYQAEDYCYTNGTTTIATINS